MNAEPNFDMDFDLSELEDIEATEIALLSDEVKRLEGHRDAAQVSLHRTDRCLDWIRRMEEKLAAKRQRLADQLDKAERLIKARKRFLFDLQEGVDAR